MSSDLHFIGSESVQVERRHLEDRRDECGVKLPETRFSSLFNFSASHLFTTKSARTGENICKHPNRKVPMAPNWLLGLHPLEEDLLFVNRVVVKHGKTGCSPLASRVADSGTT